MASPDDLPADILLAIRGGSNVLSVISYWEVVLKSSKGKLDVGDPRAWWETALVDLAATPLQLRAEHVTELRDLPAIHRDPFDRVLIAQSIVEGFQLVTTDATIAQYASERLRLLRG